MRLHPGGGGNRAMNPSNGQTETAAQALGVEWSRRRNTLSRDAEITARGKRLADEIQSHLQDGSPMNLALSMSCISLPLMLAAAFVPAARAQEVTEIGGQKVVTISRTPVSTTRPEFTSITIAPGRGMEVLQITANFPGKGEVNVLASPDLAGAKKMLDVDDDANGDLGYRLGAAFLAPYPNRIRASSPPTARLSPRSGRATH